MCIIYTKVCLYGSELTSRLLPTPHHHYHQHRHQRARKRNLAPRPDCKKVVVDVREFRSSLPSLLHEVFLLIVGASSLWGRWMDVM